MAKGGAASAAAVAEVLGTVAAAAVLRLVAARLIETVDEDLALTETGWAWCAEQLHTELPDTEDELGGALYAELGAIGRYLDRPGVDLSLGEWVVSANSGRMARG